MPLPRPGGAPLWIFKVGAVVLAVIGASIVLAPERPPEDAGGQPHIPYSFGGLNWLVTDDYSCEEMTDLQRCTLILGVTNRTETTKAVDMDYVRMVDSDGRTWPPRGAEDRLIPPGEGRDITVAFGVPKEIVPVAIHVAVKGRRGLGLVATTE